MLQCRVIGCNKCTILCVCACVCMLSRVLFFATTWTVALQAPPSMGFPRREYWSDLPFLSPGDLPRDSTCISCRQILYYCATWEAHHSVGNVNNGGRPQSRTAWQLFVPSCQFFCESNTALIKIKTKQKQKSCSIENQTLKG